MIPLYVPTLGALFSVVLYLKKSYIELSYSDGLLYFDFNFLNTHTVTYHCIHIVCVYKK